MDTTFAAIDFETANGKRDSACALSVVLVNNNQIVNQSTYLIKPPYDYFAFTHIHGITFEDVEDKPDFGLLWPEIIAKLKGVSFIAAHNASFDRSVLLSCCSRYSIMPPELPFVCTVKVARKVWGIYPTTLPSVCERLTIPLNHHDASSDALACAKIIIAAVQHGEILPPHEIPSKRKKRGILIYKEE